MVAALGVVANDLIAVLRVGTVAVLARLTALLVGALSIRPLLLLGVLALLADASRNLPEFGSVLEEPSLLEHVGHHLRDEQHVSDAVVRHRERLVREVGEDAVQLERLSGHGSRARARDGAETPFEVAHASFDLLLVRGTRSDRDGLSVAVLARGKRTLRTLLLRERRDFVCDGRELLGRGGGCVHFSFFRLTRR